MNTSKAIMRTLIAFSLGIVGLVRPPQVAAEPTSSIPPIIDAGLALLAKNGIDVALDTWQKGGLLEGDGKVRVLSNYVRRLDRALGNYKSSELLETKPLGQSSRIVYVAMNFQRGAVYARFALYRADKDWVVQNLDFSTKPETIMPWLAFEGAKYTE